MYRNVFYNPEDYGLSLVETLDEPDLSYEYNMLIVLKHNATGRVFYAQDSGCSCPTPFENYRFNTSVSGIIDTDMSEITEASIASFESDVNGFPVSMDERQQCISKVRKLLRP